MVVATCHFAEISLRRLLQPPHFVTIQTTTLVLHMHRIIVLYQLTTPQQSCQAKQTILNMQRFGLRFILTNTLITLQINRRIFVS